MPAAIMLPVKVMEPITIAKDAVTRENRSSWGASRRESRATSIEAAPPRPLKKATNWGISIILILTVQTRPMTRPTAILPQRSQSDRISYRYKVTRTAARVQPALSRLPLTAVGTLLIMAIPTRTPRVSTAQIM